MINFQSVSKIYQNNSHTTAALDDISFEIKSKEFVSLVGKSGAGKSTIIKLLIAEETPTKGKIIVSNHNIDKLAPSDLPHFRRHIGVIFQDFRLLNHKTAYENVSFALEAAGRPQIEINEFVPQALEMVGLVDKMKNFPKELSGGEKQRVAIARAMINHPEILIADEPTGNLDPINTKEIIDLLLKINEIGTIILLATHNSATVDHLKKRVIELENGKIIRDEERGKYEVQ